MINYKRHRTLSSLFKLLWGVSLEEYKKSVVHGVDIDTGKNVKYAGADEVTLLLEKGFWGFSDAKNNTIHFWVDMKKADGKEFLYFIAHELGHISGKKEKNVIDEEKRANSYGAVTLEAVKGFNKVFKTTLNKKTK
jgi:hypothetical protein